MIGSLAFFTINALLLKYLSTNVGISPWVTLAFRATVGLIVVKIGFSASGTVDFRRAATNKWLVARGLFGVLGSVAYYFTVPTLGAGKATLISNFYVVIAAVLAAFFLRERITVSKIGGNVIACCGLILLLGVTLFGALMSAATVVVIRQLTQTESSAMIYTTQCLYILAASLPIAIYVRPELTMAHVVLLLIAGVSATFGQLAMTDGFRYLTVSVGGAFQVLAPMLISFGSVLCFAEAFSVVQVIGATLILAGCYSVVALK
jgi:drug/metabolite transporter (DMT)-like permease